MIRAWRCIGLATTAFVLLACSRQKQIAADAGRDLDGAALGSPPEASQAPPSAVPALANPEPTHKRPGSRCPGAEVAILLQAGEEACVIECKSHSGCPAGWACDGDGLLATNGRPGNPIQFCRIASRARAADAGPPPATAVDAGTPPPQVRQPDAGPPARKLDVKQVNGQCPAGYRACGAMCRLTCASEGDCGPGAATCQAGFCMGPGVRPCGK